MKTSNFRKKLFHLSKILHFANQKLFFLFQKLPITSEKQLKILENNLSFSAQAEKLDLFRLRIFSDIFFFCLQNSTQDSYYN